MVWRQFNRNFSYLRISENAWLASADGALGWHVALIKEGRFLPSCALFSCYGHLPFLSPNLDAPARSRDISRLFLSRSLPSEFLL